MQTTNLSFDLLSEDFPNILDSQEEKELLERLCKNDLEARNKLVMHNLRLVRGIINRFGNLNMENEDLFSIGIIGLIKAVDSFNLDKKIKFGSYATRCIENEILLYNRKASLKSNELSIDLPVSTDKNGKELFFKDILTSKESVFDYVAYEDCKEKILVFLENICENDKQFVKLRYGLEFTQKKIADEFGIMQSNVHKREKKFIKNLKEYLNGYSYALN